MCGLYCTKNCGERNLVVCGVSASDHLWWQKFYQPLSNMYAWLHITKQNEVLTCGVACACVPVCACVCEGHSTVLYIKLSAPRHCSINKWSPMTGGGGVAFRLWIKSVPSSRSLMLGIVVCVCFCVECLCTQCLQFTDFFSGHDAEIPSNISCVQRSYTRLTDTQMHIMISCM